MKKILSLLCFTLLIALTFPAISYAEKVLFFTPTRIALNDQKKVEVMNITNLSNITRAYKISFQDQVMTYEGTTTPVDTFQYSAKRLLRFVPREFVLKPGDRQTIRIMSRLRPDTEDGEYHTHIRFLEDVSKRNEINPPKGEQGASIAAPLAYEALIPAIISHGNIQTGIDIKNAKISKTAQNDYKIDLSFTRNGNGQGRAFIDTHYIAPDGSTTLVTPRRTVNIYREISERVKDYSFTLPKDVPAGGSLKLSLYNSKAKDAAPIKKIPLALPQ